MYILYRNRSQKRGLHTKVLQLVLANTQRNKHIIITPKPRFHVLIIGLDTNIEVPFVFYHDETKLMMNKQILSI